MRQSEKCDELQADQRTWSWVAMPHSNYCKVRFHTSVLMTCTSGQRRLKRNLFLSDLNNKFVVDIIFGKVAGPCAIAMPMPSNWCLRRASIYNNPGRRVLGRGSVTINSCLYGHVCMLMHACFYVCKYLRHVCNVMYVCMVMCVRLCKWTWLCLSVCMRLCTCTYVVCKFMYGYFCNVMHVCIYVCMYGYAWLLINDYVDCIVVCVYSYVWMIIFIWKSY